MLFRTARYVKSFCYCLFDGRSLQIEPEPWPSKLSVFRSANFVSQSAPISGSQNESEVYPVTSELCGMSKDSE